MEVKTKNAQEKILFFNKNEINEPLSTQSKYIEHMADNDPDQPGVVLPNGTINWNCPCLGTASIGPCSQLFRAAFKCFHFSESEAKGSECLKEFEKLQNCMKKYPALYK